MSNIHDFIKTQLLAAAHFQETLDEGGKKWLKSGGIADGRKFLEERKFPKSVIKAYDTAMKNVLAGKDFEEDVDPHLQEVQNAVKERLPKLTKDTSIPIADIKTLKDVSLILRTESDSAWARVEKDIGRLRDEDLNRIIAPAVESSSKYVKDLKAAFKKLTGKDGTDFRDLEELADLDTDEYREAVKKIMGKKPAAAKEFTKARSEYTKASKKAHMAHVRASGSHLMDVETAKKHLESKGFRHSIPEGFKGKLDENGRIHTEHGEPIAGGISGTVKMNPKYEKGSSVNVLTYYPPGAKTPQYLFTAGAKANAIQKKSQKVDELSDKIGDLRKKWGADLNSKDPSTRIAAAILEACYHTSARIGNLSNKNDGMTTLKGRNVKVNGDTVTFSYTGKSDQQQKHVMKGDDPISKKAVEIIKALKENAKPDDLLFRNKNRRVGSRQVNDYFTSLGSPTTVHKMRHVRGNAIMKEELKKKPKTDDDKKITAFLTAALAKVGEQLGHFNKGEVTFATALQSYVSPSIVEKYYDSYNIRPPARIQKVIDQAKKDNGEPTTKLQDLPHHGDVAEKPKVPRAVKRVAKEEKEAPKPRVVKKVEKPAPKPLRQVKKVEKPEPKERKPTRTVKHIELGPLSAQPVKTPAWFQKLSGNAQRTYIKENPHTKLKPTKLPGSK